MLAESEKALNDRDGMTAKLPNVDARPLFARVEWFDALYAGCFAGVPAVTLSSADETCTLRLVETKPGRLASLSNWYSFRWAPAFEGEFDAAVLTEVCRGMRERAWLFEASPLNAVDANRLKDALKSAGWRVHKQQISTSCWVDSHGRTFDQWWSERPGQLRSTVARKSKKAVVAIAVHQEFSDALWDAYESVYQHSWKPEEGTPAFIRSWAADAAARGALRLGLATIEGRPVAAQFWTVEAGVASIHKLAQIQDPVADAASPGTLLTHALYRHAFDVDHVDRIDFGTGADRFKADWTDQRAELFRIVAFDLRRPQSWLHLLNTNAQRLAARLRRR
jgi:hypothetical protein